MSGKKDKESWLAQFTPLIPLLCQPKQNPICLLLKNSSAVTEQRKSICPQYLGLRSYYAALMTTCPKYGVLANKLWNLNIHGAGAGIFLSAANNTALQRYYSLVRQYLENALFSIRRKNKTHTFVRHSGNNRQLFRSKIGA